MLNGGNYSQLGHLHVSTQTERMNTFLFALLCAMGRIRVDTFSILCFLWNCLSSHDAGLPAGYWHMAHCQCSTLWGWELASDPARFLFFSFTEPELCMVQKLPMQRWQLLILVFGICCAYLEQFGLQWIIFSAKNLKDFNLSQQNSILRGMN